MKHIIKDLRRERYLYKEVNKEIIKTDKRARSSYDKQIDVYDRAINCLREIEKEPETSEKTLPIHDVSYREFIKYATNERSKKVFNKDFNDLDRNQQAIINIDIAYFFSYS